MKSRMCLFWIVIAMALPMLLVANVMFGAISLPPGSVFGALFGAGTTSETTHFIVVESRCPAAITAAAAGAAVAMSGLLLQFLFRNTLAGPSVLGISTGAGMGVAVATLCLGSGMAALHGMAWGHLAIAAAAIAGAIVSTLIIMAVSARIESDVMVLVAGMMIGQITSAAIALMSVMATADGLRSFIMWGMGSFNGVAWSEMAWLIAPVAVSYAAAAIMAKQLNVAMLGHNYATNLGIDMRHLRHAVLLSACVPVAATTAFCGPIALLGLAMPHVARLSLRTDDFKRLLPASAAAGMVTALACNLASNTMMSGGISLPINVLTPVICSPIIIYIILKQ